MNQVRVLQTMLEENGFELVRRGKHAIYKRGTVKMILPTGTKFGTRQFLNYRAQIRRALKYGAVYPTQSAVPDFADAPVAQVP